MVQSYGFRPNIVSTGPSRGTSVFDELYQDALQKRQKLEEIAKKYEAERAAKLLDAQNQQPFKTDSDLQQPSMPAPTEDWPLGPFVPQINQVPGVSPRYLQPRRNYEPIDGTSAVTSDRKPWVSPLEAASIDAAQRERERGQARTRRSRSAEPHARNDVLDHLAHAQPTDRNGLRKVRQVQQPYRATRVKSDSYMRPTVSSNLRSPTSPHRIGQSPADSPDLKFRYVPMRSDDGRPLSVRSLDREVMYHQTPAQASSSISGLRSLGSYAGNVLPAAGGKVARTVDSQPRVVDLT
jgi:hypothetical protein